ncbi:uncharacterized protein LOC110847894 [Folsomia candida]|nr:uncharacterized protein LOC110847894 [Folsomia candida]
MKTVLAIALFASMASVILSRQVRPVRPAVQVVTTTPLPELPEETKEVILEYVAEKMEDAYPNMFEEIQTRANLFNLSAYINNPNRPNGTALTFVPLITLLSGLISG